MGLGPPWDASAQPPAAPPPLPPLSSRPIKLGLWTWFAAIVVFGVGGVVFGQSDLAILAALSGVVIAARAADLTPRWEVPYTLVSLAFIGLCTLSFVAIAWWFRSADVAPATRTALQILCLASAALLAATGLRPVSDPLARAFFHVSRSTHTLRLAARLALFILLFAIPGWFATRQLLAQTEDTSGLFGRLANGGDVTGFVLLALAGVGFLIVRGPAATAQRLGLTRPRARDLALVTIGFVALFALNSGGDWLQRHFFPGTWAADQHVNQLIAHALDRRGMFIVGLSAGIGEELTMRGALQPRFGLVPTSLLFASLHSQYSPFGIAVVFAFGLLLGTIRRSSNTTVAIAVHAIYDVVSLLIT